MITKLLSNRKTILISAAIVLLAMISIILFFVFSTNDDQIKELEAITPLTNANEVKAVNLVKDNVVKIVNTLPDGNTIVGTGFFHESGYLLTNSHVVDIKGNIEVFYTDGTKSDAKLISNDITSDVAILKAGNVHAKALFFGETLSLEEPMTVMSIGFAYNLEGDPTVTRGAFSARRSMSGVEYLQSDAGLNYGNSGGPLMDAKGNLLGMNSYSSENATINLSISSESLENIVFKLINEQKVNYIEGARPENALSSILKSVGFSTEDIYGENQYLNTEADTEETDSDNNQASGKSTSNSGTNPNEVIADPNLPIIADNINGISYISDYSRVENTSSGYQLRAFVRLLDKFGADLPTAKTALYGSFTIELYKKSTYVSSNSDLENKLAQPNASIDGPIKIITKTFSAAQVINEEAHASMVNINIDIPVSEIYGYLTPGDYTGSDGSTNITVRVTMNTQSNGSFVGVCTMQLPPE